MELVDLVKLQQQMRKLNLVEKETKALGKRQLETNLELDLESLNWSYHLKLELEQ